MDGTNTQHPRYDTYTSHSPVGSGKTALMLALCLALRKTHSLAAVTNDIFTREDQEFLIKNKALPAERILAIETGGCPHAAIREDISANMGANTTYSHSAINLRAKGSSDSADFRTSQHSVNGFRISNSIIRRLVVGGWVGSMYAGPMA